MGGAQNFALFFRLPPPVLLFVSHCVSSRGILVVFRSAGALKCARMEFSGCCVKPRRPPKPPGFYTTTREPKHAHLRVPVFTNTTKIQREDPPEREERMKFPAGERKKERNFGRSRGRAVQGKGGPVEGRCGGGGPAEGGRGPKILKTHNHTTHNNTQHKQHKQHNTKHHTTPHRLRPFLANQFLASPFLGQSIFGPSIFWANPFFWPIRFLAYPFLAQINVLVVSQSVRPRREGGPNPEKVGPRRVGSPKFRVFFPLPPQLSFFLLSLGGPFVEFWWCF